MYSADATSPDLLVQNVLHLPVFAGLTEEDAAALVQGCRGVRYGDGQVLVGQGERSDDLYLLLSGRLRVTCLTPAGDEVVVGVAAPGAVIGEMGLISHAPRSATVRAQGGAVVLRMPGAHFGALINDAHPAAWPLLRAMREQLVERLRAVDERVDAVLEAPTEERSAAYLRANLGELLGESGGGEP